MQYQYYAGSFVGNGFSSPIILPSGSAIQAKLPVGIRIGPTSFLQPSASAFAMEFPGARNGVVVQQ